MLQGCSFAFLQAGRIGRFGSGTGIALLANLFEKGDPKALKKLAENVMGSHASYKNDLSHIETIVTTLERLTSTGDSVACTSLVNEPGYWRQRIETILSQREISKVDREHADALLRRLHGIVKLP